MPRKFRKGDRVVVLAGRDKGRTGEVVEVNPTLGRALVRGVNLVKRHQRQSAQQQGGINLQGAAGSSVQHCNRRPQGRQADAHRFKIGGDGRKVPVAKRSGVEIDG